MAGSAYTFDEDGFERVKKTVLRDERAGAEHPFYQELPYTGLDIIFGKSTEAITKGTEGTVAVYAGSTTSITDSGDTVEAFARFGDVKYDKWVGMVPTNHGYEIIVAEC